MSSVAPTNGVRTDPAPGVVAPERSIPVPSADCSDPRLLPLRNRAGTVVAHALVDADVFAWVNPLRWHPSGQGYAATKQRDGTGVWRTVYLHRLVLNAPEGAEVDHINRDRLDTRRANLRFVTRAQNTQNTVTAWGPSGVRGVYWHSQARKWQGRIRVAGRSHSLGLHDTIEAAARAVAAARLRLHPYAPVPAYEVERLCATDAPPPATTPGRGRLAGHFDLETQFLAGLARALRRLDGAGSGGTP